MQQRDQLPGLFALVVAFGLLAALARDGLFTGFTGDDAMNIYGYWFKPVRRHIVDVLWLPGGAFRPAGALFYNPLFGLYGFDAFPYRVVCLAVIAANLLVVFAAIRAMTGSSMLAGLTALLLSYHAHLADLYYCSSTIYDLLSFLFFYLGLLVYVRVRARGSVLGAWNCLALVLILWLAMSWKESAAALPAAMLAYEVAYRRADWRSPGKWLAGPGRAIVVLGAVSVVYMAPRVMGMSAMVSNPAYRLDVSIPVYAANLHRHLEHALYVPGKFPGSVFAALSLAALAAALALRNRHLLFAWLLAFVSSLPVMFLPPRGLFVMYIACAGLALYAAEVLRLAAQTLSEWWELHPRAVFPAIAALAMVLYFQHAKAKPQATAWIGPEQSKVARLLAAARTQPKPVDGAKVLILNSAFVEDDWTAVLLLRLFYRDEHLRGTWVRGSVAPAGEAFDAVLDMR